LRKSQAEQEEREQSKGTQEAEYREALQEALTHTRRLERELHEKQVAYEQLQQTVPLSHRVSLRDGKASKRAKEPEYIEEPSCTILIAQLLSPFRIKNGSKFGVRGGLRSTRWADPPVSQVREQHKRLAPASLDSPMNPAVMRHQTGLHRTSPPNSPITPSAMNQQLVKMLLRIRCTGPVKVYIQERNWARVQL
jgi:hypothetical protein